jgi:micrococcal nuclease
VKRLVRPLRSLTLSSSGEGELPVPLDGRTVRMRYLGINTPETKHPEKGVEPFGPEADAVNRRLVAGKTVRLELDVELWDRYQRLLAYIYVGDLIT